MKKLFDIYKKHKEVINYLIFGFLTTVLSLTIYYLLTFTVLNPKDAFQLQVANVTSWIGAVIFAFFTNRKYVFESKNKNISKEFIKFFLSRISTLLLDMLIMFVFVTVLGLYHAVIKIISQIFIIVGNYLLSKFFVFKKEGDKNETRNTKKRR